MNIINVKLSNRTSNSLQIHVINRMRKFTTIFVVSNTSLLVIMKINRKLVKV